MKKLNITIGAPPTRLYKIGDILDFSRNIPEDYQNRPMYIIEGRWDGKDLKPIHDDGEWIEFEIDITDCNDSTILAQYKDGLILTDGNDYEYFIRYDEIERLKPYVNGKDIL